MPHLVRDSVDLHYDLDLDLDSDDRDVVVLLHGGLATSATWTQSGYTAALGAHYALIRPDAIGHGRSGGSVDADRNGLQARAADVVAVLDHVGVERAHVIGYSMGGWTASGVALHAPDRLLSVVVGGWDLVAGMATMATAMGARDLRFEHILAMVRQFAPASVDWLAVEREPEACAAGDAISDIDGTAAAFATLASPRLLWLGADDPYHDPMRAFAAQHGIDMLSVPGDHLANDTSAEASIAGLLAFLGRVQSTPS